MSVIEFLISTSLLHRSKNEFVILHVIYSPQKQVTVSLALPGHPQKWVISSLTVRGHSFTLLTTNLSVIGHRETRVIQVRHWQGVTNRSNRVCQHQFTRQSYKSWFRHYRSWEIMSFLHYVIRRREYYDFLITTSPISISSNKFVINKSSRDVSND